MNKKKVSLVAAYNVNNRHVVESLLTNNAAKDLYELILVNEGNAEDIIHPAAISLRVTTFKAHCEPLVMAIGAHYASGDVIVLCRKPGCITDKLCRKFHKARHHHSPVDGLYVFMKSDLPWEYEIDTGFVKGNKGRFINLEWEAVNHVER